MLKLILTDMDGTLLDQNGALNTTAFKPLLKKMKANNVTFATVTGKQVQRVEELFGEMAKDIWIVGDSASRIQHGDEMVYAFTISNKEGKKLIAELLKANQDQAIVPCTPKSTYALNNYSPKQKELIRDSYAALTFVDSFSEIKGDFLKITSLDLNEHAQETYAKLDHLSKDHFIVAPDNVWIDITASDVHKGTTVAKLQSILGVTKAETVAFGDGYNDLELFDSAKTSYAMENAILALKEKATHIAPSNEEYGVFQVIEKLLVDKCLV